MPTRAGIGYDVHRRVAGRALILGGERFEGERGLDGHSDADVLLHAIGDALLGALALGDLGTHFPPGDPRWKDVSSSSSCCAGSARCSQDRGATIIHVDASAGRRDAEAGAPPRARSARNIAGALGIGSTRVSVKATTNERLGAVGRDEGIAAWAIATVETA